MAKEEQTGIIPATLPSKYMVSKAVGKGATGDVSLGFRIPNLHSVAIKIIWKETNSTVSTKALNKVCILPFVYLPCAINLEDTIDFPDYLLKVLEQAGAVKGAIWSDVLYRQKGSQGCNTSLYLVLSSLVLTYFYMSWLSLALTHQFYLSWQICSKLVQTSPGPSCLVMTCPNLRWLPVLPSIVSNGLALLHLLSCTNCYNMN